MKESKKTQAHCNVCSGDRSHEVLHVERIQFDEEDHGFWAIEEYEMLKCSGCGSVKMRYRTWCSEDYDPSGKLTPTTIYYPTAMFRAEPKWLADLSLKVMFQDGNIHDLLKEIYTALYNNQRMLAAMGIRALLERIMIEKVGDRGSFRDNLTAFKAKGFISELQRENLATIVDAGSAAIHRHYRPSQEHLVTLVEIVESIVKILYIDSDAVAHLRRAIPPRPGK